MREWELYGTYPQMWQAMLEACDAANYTIDCEQYIFEPDEIGRAFGEVFMRRTKAGVQVRLLVDAVGSSNLKDSALVAQLQSAGVSVIFHNPIRWWHVTRITPQFFRTHRKILVIDRIIAFTGGMGIAEHMKTWRDRGIRVTGELAGALARSYETMWNTATKCGRRRFEKPAAGMLAVYANSPRPAQRYFYRELLWRIRNAKQSISIITPYFVPNFRILHALKKAARKGRQVRLLLPFVSDMPIADRAAQFYFAELLKAGVKIYRYKHSVLHAKNFIIDHEWASVGSMNLDNMSLVFNYEIAVAGTDQAFVEALDAEFLKDLHECEPLHLEVWQKRSVIDKCKEVLVSLVQVIL
jgi:cardiolipin synthase